MTNVLDSCRVIVDEILRSSEGLNVPVSRDSIVYDRITLDATDYSAQCPFVTIHYSNVYHVPAAGYILSIVYRVFDGSLMISKWNLINSDSDRHFCVVDDTRRCVLDAAWPDVLEVRGLLSKSPGELTGAVQLRFQDTLYSIAVTSPDVGTVSACVYSLRDVECDCLRPSNSNRCDKKCTYMVTRSFVDDPAMLNELLALAFTCQRSSSDAVAFEACVPERMQHLFRFPTQRVRLLCGVCGGGVRISVRGRQRW